MSSTDEEIRELERRFQKEPSDQQLCQRLATAFQRQGRLSEVIDTLLRGGLFEKGNLCAQSLGEELRDLQRDTLRGLEGLYHFHGFFNVKHRLDWRYRGPDDSAMETFPEPVLGLGNLGSEDCARLKEDSHARLWLHSLDLNMSEVGLETFNWIESLPYLQILKMKLRRFERGCSFSFDKSPFLRSVDIVCREATPFFDCLIESSLPESLRSLSIIGRIDKAHISLQSFEKLESLTLDSWSTYEVHPCLSFPETLRFLDLNYSQLSDRETLRSLSKLSQLRELHLGVVNDFELAHDFLNELVSLEELTSRNVLNEELKLLPKPEKLKVLVIPMVSLEDSLIETLERFINLEELTIELVLHDLDDPNFLGGLEPYTERMRQRLGMNENLNVEVIY